MILITQFPGKSSQEPPIGGWADDDDTLGVQHAQRKVVPQTPAPQRKPTPEAR